MTRLLLALCIAIILAPDLPTQRPTTDPLKTGAVQPTLTTGDLLYSAQAFTWDIFHFCDRQPRACEVGEQAMIYAVHTLRSASANLLNGSGKEASVQVNPINSGSKGYDATLVD